MAFVLRDRVRETSITTGTGPFALGGAPSASYQSFANVMSIGDTCWYAIVLPGGAWETGFGTYSSANTLTRTTVIESSSGFGPTFGITFAAGTKDVFMCEPAQESKSFPSGTLMLFQQSSAPTYWTKQVTHNDKALRVVSGAASSGGTSAFSTVMGSAAAVVDSHILSIGEIPAHTHTYGGVRAGGAGLSGGSAPSVAPNTDTNGQISGSNGSGGGHVHTLSLNLQYVDLIIASKD